MKKTVFITGAGQGIGAFLSLEFAKLGYHVFSMDLGDGKYLLQKTSEEGLEDRIYFQSGNAGKEEDVEKSVEVCIRKFSQLDVLINNAGKFVSKPVETLSWEEWSQVLHSNLSSVFLLSKYCVQYLKKTKGSIINIASTRAFQSEPNTEAYSASKGGIVSLTHSLAISLGPEIRVNSISPGWIDVRQYRIGGENSPELSLLDHSQHPSGRVGEPGDVFRTALFLADPENKFITGQNFIVDGGITKRMIYEE
ncbi:SDR family oxidoreductase [Leptospira sarikeiensis]|uniref:SDR family oxidoreductase n=1 Tax=Leptospira sarikeiensis TaxID=2484943 RepID=A0A4R9K5B8_9LEPT|nr:SDR family oxidoreductase [Leptospira sarikeiensis]TGL60713.1 SDR family oxidoreductase [Leptospira sarikeiensis]